MKPIIFMYSGQGSHYYHMGKAFFENQPVFKYWMKKLDKIAYTYFNQSITEAIYNKSKSSSDKFLKTSETSPAIIMVEYALTKLLIENGIQPNYLLGASLGEVTALLVAGVVEVPDMMQELSKRVQLFDLPSAKGTMIGILDKIETYHKNSELNANSELAAVNLDNHFVVTCLDSKMKKIVQFLDDKQIQYQILQVSKAFHSSILDSIEIPYKDLIRKQKYNTPTVPIISCARTKEVEKFNPDYFWDIFRKPILTQKTITALEQKGNYIYVDCGPSGTLANYVKYNLNKNSDSEVFSIMSPFGGELQNLKKAKLYIVNQNKKNTKMKAFVFPGQGSQFKGMGKELFEELRDLTKIANEILGYSIEDLCVNDPENNLKLTQYTQPALFVVNALSYYKKMANGEAKPDYVAGHSLGEYNALLAAGAFDFPTGLNMVKKRGELMSKAANGGMAAVIGLNEEQTKQVIQDNQLDQIDIANLNTPVQTVISGPKEIIEQAQDSFEKAGATYIQLNVSAAFHSRYMQEAKETFEAHIKNFKFSNLEIPVISNVNANEYNSNNIAENLAEQLRSSVRWNDSIQFLLNKRVVEFEEIGPGDVLSKMITKIKSTHKPDLSKSENKNKSATANSEPKKDVRTLNVSSKDTKRKQAEKGAHKNNPFLEGENLEKQIRKWNQKYPIGTKLTAEGYDELETRTEARILFGHRAAIYMKGYNGYFSLEEIEVL